MKVIKIICVVVVIVLAIAVVAIGSGIATKMGNQHMPFAEAFQNTVDEYRQLIDRGEAEDTTGVVVYPMANQNVPVVGAIDL